MNNRGATSGSFKSLPTGGGGDRGGYVQEMLEVRLEGVMLNISLFQYRARLLCTGCGRSLFCVRECDLRQEEDCGPGENTSSL